MYVVISKTGTKERRKGPEAGDKTKKKKKKSKVVKAWLKEDRKDKLTKPNFINKYVELYNFLGFSNVTL